MWLARVSQPPNAPLWIPQNFKQVVSFVMALLIVGRKLNFSLNSDITDLFHNLTWCAFSGYTIFTGPQFGNIIAVVIYSLLVLPLHLSWWHSSSNNNAFVVFSVLKRQPQIWTPPFAFPYLWRSILSQEIWVPIAKSSSPISKYNDRFPPLNIFEYMWNKARSYLYNGSRSPTCDIRELFSGGNFTCWHISIINMRNCDVGWCY